MCLRYKFPVRPASRPTSRHIKANCGGLAARNEPVRLPLLLARRLPHAPWSLTRLARAAGWGVGWGGRRWRWTSRAAAPCCAPPAKTSSARPSTPTASSRWTTLTASPPPAPPPRQRLLGPSKALAPLPCLGALASPALPPDLRCQQRRAAFATSRLQRKSLSASCHKSQCLAVPGPGMLAATAGSVG